MPDKAFARAAGDQVFSDPMQACAGADLVTTDVWTSMGFEAENRLHVQKALMEFLLLGKL